jgi:hypothetical protein
MADVASKYLNRPMAAYILGVVLGYPDCGGCGDKAAAKTMAAILFCVETRRHRTPLHLATDKGHKDMVDLLRQHGGHE